MAKIAENYRELAARAQADADAATLDNVRDRNQRAAAAWLQMADRQDRSDTARAARSIDTVSAAAPAGDAPSNPA